MAVKRFKPVTPGTRFRVGGDYSDVTTNVPEKSLVVKIKKYGGRNNSGKMTMRYLGGGHKKAYRLIDLKRDKNDVPANVATIESYPTRTRSAEHKSEIQSLMRLSSAAHYLQQ